MPRVMVESFVATQKVSVQKSLMRTFSAKYIKQAADFNELLMSLLQAGPHVMQDHAAGTNEELQRPAATWHAHGAAW